MRLVLRVDVFFFSFFENQQRILLQSERASGVSVQRESFEVVGVLFYTVERSEI